MGAISSLEEFKPFYEPALQDLKEAKTLGGFNFTVSFLSFVNFAAVPIETRRTIADAIVSTAGRLGVLAITDRYSILAGNLRHGRAGGCLPADALSRALKQSPTKDRAQAFQALSTACGLIKRTRIAGSRAELRTAFSEKTMRVGFCAQHSDLCADVYESLDAQRDLDAVGEVAA